MNIQQLEYIVAVDQFRHFGKAAKSCHVTQPTLSMMIQKLEEELDIKIFDRSKKPVMPTSIGITIIDKARKIIKETKGINQLVKLHKGSIEGVLHLGIIPTLAPYLLPLFLKPFLIKYPGIQLKIWEYTTGQLIELLKKGILDAGLMATPVEESQLVETPVFYEPFYVYSTHTFEKEYLLPKDIDTKELWLLEEAHCFRSQVIKLCTLRKQVDRQLQYEAGSIETLIRLVDTQDGVTIVPHLAVKHLLKTQKNRLKPFKPPAPAREISVVTHQDFSREKVVEILREMVIEAIPSELRQGDNIKTIEVELKKK